jgi:DNA repair protein RecN (Recombination protein N)
MSLKRMVLRDFVIVDELDLELAGGFTVLTGETGAGKSILIDALQLVTGGRADVNVIREGCARTDVSAEFDPSPAINRWLDDAGFDHNDSLLLRRTVDSAGKSRAWINASPATAGQLRALGEQLVDIHGQHAWQSLTQPEAMRGLLDAYAKLDTRTINECWQRWRQAHEALSQARAAQSNLHNERERLAWQISELEKLNPAPDEWPDLNTEHTRLTHAQDLLHSAQGALAGLDEADVNARSQLGQALETLQKQSHIEPEFLALTEVLASSLAQVDDVVHSLRAYLRQTDLDPSRVAELDERIHLWLSLARRYKREPHELPELLAQWREQLKTLNAAADLDALELIHNKAEKAYQTEAKALSRQRQQQAGQLGKIITQVMQGLGMQGGLFEVSVQVAAQPLKSGIDEVGFLVAGHPGSSPRPVQKVASGGELSRIALAIAVTTSQLGQAQTLIFDEVDAGVGGAVAETVGRLMGKLGADRQVLAVTHLPQVCACAHHHLVVSKQAQGQSTVSHVSAVSGEARVAELARMLGGERLMDSTVAHARDLLQAQER